MKILLGKLGVIPLFGLIVGMMLTILAYNVDADYIFFHLGSQVVLLGFFLLLVSFSRTVALIVYLPLITLLIAICVVHADNFSSYGPLLRESLDAIFQTTNSEALSYLNGYSSVLLIPMLLIYLLLGWMGAFSTQKSLWGWRLGLALIVVGPAMIYQGRSLPLMVYETADDYQKRMILFVESRAKMLDEVGVVSADDGRNVILILGESVHRGHLSLYGYPRQTSPLLDNISAELVTYEDIISSHSHTNLSLSRALTFNKRNIYKPISELPDLLSVLNKSGLKTTWLSNQNTIGLWDNAVSVLSSRATESVFHDNSSGFDLEREVYDEVLVEGLESRLTSDKTGGNFIVLHMMATHFPYCAMISPSFTPPSNLMDKHLGPNFFGKAYQSLIDENGNFNKLYSSINCYDHAVSYSTGLVRQAIEIARKSEVPTAVLYVADHGEAPILNAGHESRWHMHQHVDVPFVLWRSDDFPVGLGLKPSRSASLEDISNSIADLFDLKGIGLDQRSIFSEGYVTQPRHTLDGRVGYDTGNSGDHIERARANLNQLAVVNREKIWVHRVNSGAKMMEAKELFAGVELDVVFADGIFSVYHPPAVSVGLTLASQLAKDKRNIGFWLDWKNADISNVDLALQRLEELDQTFGLKSRILIEISALDGSARKLVSAGWRTSYYLPTNQVLDCMKLCEYAEREQLKSELWENYEQAGFTALSFDARLIPFVGGHMLSRIQSESVPTYTWSVDINMSEDEDLSKIKPILAHDWINLLLVRLPSYFDL